MISSQIEPPLEDVPFDYEGVIELALIGPLAFGTYVHEERPRDTPPPEVRWTDSLDMTARLVQQLVDGCRAHGATSRKLDGSGMVASSRAATHSSSRGIKTSPARS